MNGTEIMTVIAISLAIVTIVIFFAKRMKGE